MDDRINKSPFGRDVGADDQRKADSAPHTEPVADGIDCSEDNDLDIIFEFESPEDGSH